MLKQLSKQVVNRVLSTVFNKPLTPPTTREKELIEELKMTFRELPYLDTAKSSPSEKIWFNYMNHLRDLVLTHDPRNFLCWDVVLYTMFVGYARYIITELKYLQGLPTWKSRWREAIEETYVGHPIRYWYYSRSSGNLIHHAYHIAKFEEKTEISIDSLDYVFEFGGGYGSMCRLLHKLDFKGKYIIFDLPAFSALQRFFLKSINIPVHTPHTFETATNGVVCISDLDQLKEVFSAHTDVNKSLFIATWSLSEVPTDLRTKILPLISDFNSFLIAYQDRFKEVDNIEFFKEWQALQRDVEWMSWKIEHLPHDSYLVGKRKS